MNTPNKLSLLRVALIPVLVLCMYLPGWPMVLLSAAVFGAAAYTDYLDGHIARRDGLVTDFGKFIDPVADKLLNLSAMIMLTYCGLLPQWAVIVILARELAVDGLRMVCSAPRFVRDPDAAAGDDRPRHPPLVRCFCDAPSRPRRRT